MLDINNDKSYIRKYILTIFCSSISTKLENSKLIYLLKSFTPEERKEFQKYIDSPFFNNETSISKFYSVLKKTAPDFHPKNIKKEKLYTKVYPGRSYNDVIMRNLISRTLRFAEGYITLKEFSIDFDYKSIIKMRALSNRNQSSLFEKAKKEASDMPNNDISEAYEFPSE